MYSKKIFYILICFIGLLSFSCSQKSDVLIDGQMAVVNPVDNIVSNVNEDRWKVGALGKQTISKGIRVDLLLPLIHKEDMKSVINLHDMDSWIVKVKQSSISRSQIIGYIYFPLMAPGYSRGSSLRVKQMKKGVFGIYYSAAAVSSRLARLNCPAFKHQFRAEDLEVEDDSSRSEKVYISKSQSKRITAKVEKFDNRIILNGGDRLRGEYYFQLAAYNSIKKLRLSNWVDFKGRVIVGMDKKVEIKGCADAKIPPLNDPSLNKQKEYKFGR